MPITEESIAIVSYLSKGPKVPLRDSPLFQLVWSNDARELRRGEYSTYIESILVKTETKVSIVPKYNWLFNRWILEKWFPPEVSFTPELPESKYGSFEPVYVFEDADGNELPLKLEVVQFVVRTMINMDIRPQLIKSTISQQMQDKDDLIATQDWEVINEDSSLISQLHDGTAILRP